MVGLYVYERERMGILQGGRVLLTARNCGTKGMRFAKDVPVPI